MSRRPSRATPASTLQSANIPAPVGGINTIDPASAMPITDCIYAFNLLPGEYGMRSRLGYREWCTGLTGSINASVRTVIPFTGSKKNGSTDKLFACTDTGIWDVSASTQTPTQVVAFPTVSADSGWGVSHVVPSLGGAHVLMYCDEENGLYVYTEATTTWVKVVQAANTAWAPSTTAALGSYVSNGGITYKCTTAGTTAASPATGPAGTGTSIVDGTAVWVYAPSLSGVDPATLAHVTVWSNRVWFTQKDTTLGWYLGINAIYGAATSFDFSMRFRAGGPLVGLFNWTMDGGSGMTNSLVAVSTGGDVAIYQGTDPASASTFGLKGTWYVGGVPYGRRIATDYGGDMLLLSSIGVMPLSKLVVGSQILDRSQYATAKIANMFNVLASTYKTLRAWSLRIHPNDNALLITVPTADGQPTTQLAMSLSTRGWSKYRDLPIVSMEAWGGQMYFGTADGRVCVNTDYVDNVLLSNPNAYTPVQYSLLTSFQNLGNGRIKRVQMIRPTIISQGALVQPQASAKYRYDTNEPAAPSGLATNAGSTWDNGLWDSATWGGDYSAQQSMQGAAGCGPEVAIAIRGSATSRTAIVGIDVFFDQGGVL